MEAPEFMTPEDGWRQISLSSLFTDGRKIDIFCHENEFRSQYAIYIADEEQGEIIYTNHWYPLNSCTLSPDELEKIYKLIEQSELKPALTPDEPKSEAEIKLNKWLDEHLIYPRDYDSQCVVVNSFYEEAGLDNDDEWENKINYASGHFGLFQSYVDDAWRE